MPSRPHLRNLSDQIDQLGGEEWVFDQIAAAEPMRSIASHFQNPETGKPYTRQMIYAWIHAGGEAREKKWEEAKKIAAHIHAEDAGEILDSHRPISSADVAHVKNRAEHRKWIAKTFNRAAYGEDSGKIGLQLNIGSMHLDALRASSGGRQIEAPTPALLADGE